MEDVRNNLKIEIIRKVILKKVSSNNQNYLSMDFTNHMRSVIAILPNKMKFLWISLYT